jgi:GMP synthase-like glutamine amidotransferase
MVLVDSQSTSSMDRVTQQHQYHHPAVVVPTILRRKIVRKATAKTTSTTSTTTIAITKDSTFVDPNDSNNIGQNDDTTTTTTTTTEKDNNVYSSSSSNNNNNNNNDGHNKDLVLIVLGCEANPPYGPYLHTAELFLDLLEISVQKLLLDMNNINNNNNNDDNDDDDTSNNANPRQLELKRMLPTGEEEEAEDVLGFSSIVLQLYPVSQGIFPTYEDLISTTVHGVIVPGSFNSAYDDVPWINQLKGLIQHILVPHQIPTLGVCFGHQIYAHSFGSTNTSSNSTTTTTTTTTNTTITTGTGPSSEYHHDDTTIGTKSTGTSAGSAVKCPAGRQAGRKTSYLTIVGQRYLRRSSSATFSASNHENNPDRDETTSVPTTTTHDGATSANDGMDNLDLFYTHGDMVDTLPPQGVSLGGNSKVPIQVAMYFATTPTSTDDSMIAGSDDSSLGTIKTEDTSRAIAVTFQAHPEYASSRERGLEGTLQSVIREMASRGDITAEEAEQAHRDSILHYEEVREHSIDVTIKACQLLGWFPETASVGDD